MMQNTLGTITRRGQECHQ